MTEPRVTTGKVSHADLLRGVAALLDANPGIDAPEVSYSGAVNWYGLQDADEVAAIMRAIPGRWDKNDPAASPFDDGLAMFRSTFMGAPATIYVSRSRVCTRTVVGTRQVTKTVPVITEQVTVEEDIVAWECAPILAQVSA